MTISSFTLDASLIGTIVGPPDGYINRFELLTAAWPPWQADGWQAAPHPHGTFRGGGKLVLRDGDGLGLRILAFNPTYAPTPIIRDASFGYRGGLMLESCPRGAAYRLDLSDTPVTRADQAA
jgi:hypothetical protein